MDLKELQDAIKATVQDGIASLKTELSQQIQTDTAPIKARIDEIEKRAVRVDANGRKFLFPDGKEIEGAPFVNRGGVGQSKPLMLSNIWRAVHFGASNPAMRGPGGVASEELDMSQRLMNAGYQAEYAGSCLFPWGEDMIMEPVDAKGNKLADFSSLRKEIGERMRLTIDPGEVGWTVKRNPALAAQFGLTHKDMQLGDDTLGGILVPSTQSDRIIDLLRAQLTVMRAGAREFPLPPSGNLALPKITSDPTFAWTDPDTTTDTSLSNVGTGVVRLQAKSLRGALAFPNDLARYSAVPFEALMRAALAAAIAPVEDQAFLEAVGSSNQPKGIINYPQSTANTPAQGKVTLMAASTTTGTTGDIFEPEDVNRAIALYETGKDPQDTLAWIMRPLFWARISNKRADAFTSGDNKGPFMFVASRADINAPIGMSLGGYPVRKSTSLSARTKGATTTLTYALFGNFTRLLIGRVGVVELAMSEHVKFLQDKTVLRAVERVDSGLEHEESFVFIDTLLE